MEKTDVDRLRSLDREHMWYPWTPMAEWMAHDQLVVERADGCWLIDPEGRRYLDGRSSMGMNLHGHGRAELVEALVAQARRAGETTLYRVSHPAAVELAARLAGMAPPGLKRVFFAESGSTAVETALKAAYAYWVAKGQPQRSTFVSMAGGYHGETLGTISLRGTNTTQPDMIRALYAPLLYPSLAFDQPHCYRCPVGKTRDGCALECADSLEEILSREKDRIAAVVVEPRVQPLAGVVTAPEGHLAKVAEITRRHGVLLIADEVLTGWGRTGTTFSCEAEGVSPDLLTVGKALTGGYLPLSATLATEEIFDAFRGGAFLSGSTYSGYALGAAVALASLDLYEKEDVLGRARALAEVLAAGLEPFRALPHVGDVRQLGLVAGVEIVADRETRTPFPPQDRVAHRICDRARDHGVLVNPVPGDVITLLPSPSMSHEDLRFLTGTLLRAVREVTGT
ncbi:aspartate aminotransferase family protein [Streptomyces sp. B1866]|uniref:aminotransferase family protein n=1 Tax=Streptomyces sp. B1866 TaxID=3075431 RepID=UPI00288CC84C|nr:aspartate aminotransferase family protein [Streptomyces sp. B1866]MDT3398603.1 aspartate aminotransferase family protein [Streptomyces sp. B1866]